MSIGFQLYVCLTVPFWTFAASVGYLANNGTGAVAGLAVASAITWAKVKLANR